MPMKIISFTFCFIIANALFAQGHFYGNGKLSIDLGSEVEVKGNVVLNHPVTGDGFFSMTGNSNQYLSGSDLMIDNFRMNSTNPSFIKENFHVIRSADFQSGKLRLETHHLRCDTGIIFTGGNTNSFIETPDSGKVILPLSNNSIMVPLGAQNYFLPITLTENGQADTFSLSVFDYLPANGQYAGPPVTNDVALLSWNITDKTTGGNVLDVIIQWPDAGNDVSFNQRFAVPLWFDSSDYTAVDSCATDVRSIDPNWISFQTSTIGTFGVGDEFYLSYTPEYSILPATDTAFCDGGSALYLAGSGQAYLWNTGDSTSTLSITQSGVYSVSIQNIFGCWYNSDSVEIVVWPLPNPFITRTDSTLSTATANTYQWYVDGNLIPGAINQSYTVQQNGTYTVEVTNSFGCSSLSSPVIINDLSLQLSDNDWTYYVGPNPSDGNCIIHLSNLPDGNVNYLLTDVSGRMVLQGLISELDTHLKIYTSGIYLLSIYLDGELLDTEKLIVK